MNDIQGMMALAKIDHEDRIKEAARWNRATESKGTARRTRGNRLFGRNRGA